MIEATTIDEPTSGRSPAGTSRDRGYSDSQRKRWIEKWERYAATRKQRSDAAGTRLLAESGAGEVEDEKPSIPPTTKPLAPDAVVQQRALQSWECEILSDDGESVRVAMRDITQSLSPSEFADMEPEELLQFLDGDRSKLLPGTVFYWTIGEERLRGGTYRKFSEMRLKRYPKASSRLVSDRLGRAEADANFMRTIVGQ